MNINVGGSDADGQTPSPSSSPAPSPNKMLSNVFHCFETIGGIWRRVEIKKLSSGASPMEIHQ